MLTLIMGVFAASMIDRVPDSLTVYLSVFMSGLDSVLNLVLVSALNIVLVLTLISALVITLKDTWAMACGEGLEFVGPGCLGSMMVELIFSKRPLL